MKFKEQVALLPCCVDVRVARRVKPNGVILVRGCENRAGKKSPLATSGGFKTRHP